MDSEICAEYMYSRMEELGWHASYHIVLAGWESFWHQIGFGGSRLLKLGLVCICRLCIS